MTPDVLASELLAIVHDAIVGQPRSQQKRIGPSELGNPCDRRIGYRLAEVPAVNDLGAAWKPYIGTAVHEAIGTVIGRLEHARMQQPGYRQRFHVEERLLVGSVRGQEIHGSCDLFDEEHGAVWDWKFTTRNKIREEYRPHGPGDQYRVQAHIYARGWQLLGHEVRSVGIVFLTRDGEFTDRHVWHEPYDPTVAEAAFQRAGSIATALDALGPDFTLPTLPTAPTYCRFCPWFTPGATHVPRSCPGHPQDELEQPSLPQLIGAGR